MSAFIFVTGGVCSSLGKGVAAASMGRLLVDRGLTVQLVKADPYLNTDPGVLSPSEHGEVWVCADGTEADLDLGHYERFTSAEMSAASSVTAGSVYWSVLTAERRGDYLGQTVQSIPHITDAIKERFSRASSSDVDVVIVEVGGTVGDIEIQPFLEAIRQIRADGHNVANVHLTLVPEVGPTKEMKTKPSQHSVTLLRAYGVTPDVLVARSSSVIPERLRVKLARSCGLNERHVVSAPDLSSIYEIPKHLAAEKLDCAVLEGLGMSPPERDSSTWDEAVANLVSPPESRIRIGVVGKYLGEGHDTYLSVAEALRHAAAFRGTAVEINWIDAANVEQIDTELESVDGLVIPGGFGGRAVAGKILAARYAREHNLPCLGICLGLQVMVIEFARTVAQISAATSGEWDETGPQVVALLKEQRNIESKGASMRLGAYPAHLQPGTVTALAYGLPEGGIVHERHRHRYELNPAFHQTLEDAGLVIAGRCPEGRLAEHIELPGHTYFVATQAHPELQSRPGEPHPLFSGLIAAAS